MKRQQKPTEAQAELVRLAGLDPETVTVTTTRAALPLAITYHGDGGPLHYWIARECGLLRLSEEKPGGDSTRKTPLHEGRAPAAIYIPEQLEADLRQRNFRTVEARAIVAQVCDGDTVREAAAKIGKSHGWVSSKRIQRMVKALRAGEPLPAVTPSSNGMERKDGYPESLLQYGRVMLQTVERVEKPLRWPWDTHIASGQPLADNIATTLRQHPDCLLSRQGRLYVAALADILEAAKAGQCAHRVRGIVPEGTPSEKSAAARRALSILTSPTSGQSYQLPTVNLDLVLHCYFKRIVELQREWKASNEAIPVRLETIREAHRQELEGISDKQLRELMTHDCYSGPSRLAEIATGYSRELFEKRCTRIGFKSFRRILDTGRYDHLLPT